MKLITKTLTKHDSTEVFFQSPMYGEYQLFIDKLFIDRSISFHKNVMYIIEIIPDHLADEVEAQWQRVIKDEDFETRKITFVKGQTHAIDKK
jgi:hypothetical protein